MLGLVGGSSAAAHSTLAHAGISPQLQTAADIRESIGSGVSLRADGLYEIPLENGTTLFTHGPDPAPTDSRGRLGPGDPERDPACSTDYYAHVLYANVAGTASRYSDVKSNIRHAIKRMDAALNADSGASGGPSADYRVLCENGRSRVDRFVTYGKSYADVISSARTAGFNQLKTNYIVFVDSPGPGGACGFGSVTPDDSLSLDNGNNDGGAYAVAYRGCWGGATPMHESGHNMGAVQSSAANSTGTGRHCSEELDIMCYSPDGGTRNQTSFTSCSSVERFDCRWNDYFDTAPEPGEYLASHWNLGSPLNRFIRFRH